MKRSRFIRTKVFMKQFLSYFLVLLLFTSIIGYTIFSIAYDMLREQSEKHYQMMLNDVKNNIENSFNEIYRLNIQLFGTPWFTKIIDMKSEIDSERFSEYDLGSIYEELSNYKAVNSFIEDIFVYFKNSDLVISPYGRDSSYYFFQSIFKVDSSNRSDMDKMMQGLPYPVILPNVHLSVFNRSYDALIYMRSPSIGYKATVVTVIKKEKLNSLLNSMDENVFILDSQNRIIAGNTESASKIGLTGYDSLTDGVVTKRIGREEFIISSAESSTSGWKYITVVPVKSIMAKAIYLKWFFIIMFFAVFLTGLIILLILTLKLLEPIQRINTMIGKIDEAKVYAADVDLEFIEQSFNRLVYQKNALEEDFQKYEPVLKSNFLTKWIMGNVGNNEYISGVLENYGIYFPHRYFIVTILIIECDKDENVESNSKINETIVILVEIINSIIKESKYTGYAFQYEYDKIALIQNTNTYSYMEKIYFNDICIKLKEKAENMLDTTLTIAVGGVHESLAEVYLSFREALQALDYKLVRGKSSIITYKSLSENASYSYYYPIEREIKLIHYLKNGDYYQIENIIDEIVNENLGNHTLDFAVARCLFYDLEATALKALEEIAPALIEDGSITKGLSSINTFSEMVEHIKEIYKYTCSLIQQKKDNKSQTIIDSILANIDEGYMDPNFSLAVTADKFKMSKSYISKFFKEQTGLYYSDYLNRKRIDKAKELLEKTTLSIRDIALEVGYINDVTFRRIFKQVEKITPVEYRNAVQK